MNTVLHLVRKDLRRLAAPLALWLALVAGKALALLLYATSSLPWAGEWIGPAAAYANGMEAVVGLLLVVMLVLEDAPTDTRAFWRTRPISGVCLLAAKAAGAALMVVALPLALLTPIWIAAGFDAREVGLAALDWTLLRGTLALAVLALAAAAGGWSQAVFGALGLGPVALAGVLLGWRIPGGWMGGIGGAALAAGVSLVFQYGARRRAPAAVVLAVGLGVSAAGIRWAVEVRPPTVDESAFEKVEPGLPLVVGVGQETGVGRARVAEVRRVGGERVRVALREHGFDSVLFRGAWTPDPILGGSAAPSSPDQPPAGMGRRGTIRAASLRVIDREAVLSPEAAAEATWQGWRRLAGATERKRENEEWIFTP